jgi:hypothetical protein
VTAAKRGLGAPISGRQNLDCQFRKRLRHAVFP